MHLVRLGRLLCRLVCWSVAVSFLVGCAMGGAAKSPPRAAYARGAQNSTAVADNDRDGIPDKLDEAAPEPPPPPGAMAPPADAPAKGMLAAPAQPKPAPSEKKPDSAGGEKPKEQPSGEQQPHDTAMLIYTAKITMAVYQVDQGLAAVEKVARDMGGYLSVKHDREITIRVPRARFDPTLAAIDKIGDVLHRDIQAQDVTDEYVDLEIRIKNARAMQQRLKQLLEKAAVKEALEIEKEMRRVTEELELLEGKIKLLRDKIAYSTITVAFEARGSSIQSTKIRLPFPWLGALGLPNLLQLQESK